MITRNPTILDGEAHIEGTTVPVHKIIRVRAMGATLYLTASIWHDLSMSDVQDAEEYYQNNKEEIDLDMMKNDPPDAEVS